MLTGDLKGMHGWTLSMNLISIRARPIQRDIIYIWAGVGVMKHVNAAISYYHANSISVSSSVSIGHGITLAIPPSPKQPEDRLLVELNVVF